MRNLRSIIKISHFHSPLSCVLFFLLNMFFFLGKANGQDIEIGKVGSGITMDGIDGIGINVRNSSGDGIRVSGSTNYGINISGTKSGSTLQGHVALIQNSSNSTDADVLALRIGKAASASLSNNYITFYNGLITNNIDGEIDGNGMGGVRYMSSGADYGEYLPVMDVKDQFSAGDIVGLYGGKVSHRTKNADNVMVISNQSVVVGNMPKNKEDLKDDRGYEIVSFIGQVKTKVRGPVLAGDWIVASGQEDGVGKAVSCEEISLASQIVGRAWESSNQVGIHMVNVAVGLNHNQAYRSLIERQTIELKDQQTQINELREMVNNLNLRIQAIR